VILSNFKTIRLNYSRSIATLLFFTKRSSKIPRHCRCVCSLLAFCV